MEHLSDTHGPIDIHVTRILDEDVYGADGQKDLKHAFDKFHSFPAQHGWMIRRDYRLEFDRQALKLPDSPLADKLGCFLQSWLFFGLIYTIIRHENGPLLKFRQLSDGKNITTSCLKDALGKWYDWVEDQKRQNHDQARLYMVMVELALNKAKTVVRQNCGYRTSDAGEPEVLYSTERGDNRYVSDELALSLMVLGETLSMWKARIMERTKTFVRGWHSEEEDEGWGPPRRVFSDMKDDHWCRRSIHLLQSQLRSSASLLLGAYISHRDNKQRKWDGRRHGEEKCTDDLCNVVSGQLGKYETAHVRTPNCTGHQCGRVEADMKDILKILASEDSNAIPLLTIKKTGDGRFSLAVNNLSAMTWKAQYATISHVWSDGWGNEEGNWLRTCQIKLIFEKLASGVKQRKIGSIDENDSIPFWMDTLIIPVGNQKKLEAYNQILKDENLSHKGRDARALRTKAIEQIGIVYPRSNFTIVLDNGLSSMSINSSLHCQSAMRILASNWIKRLWTLQEAVLSRKLYIAFLGSHRDDDGILDLEEVLSELSWASNDSGPGSLGSIARGHLTKSIMSSARKKPGDDSEEFRVHDPYMFVVNSWRAARWRSTSNEAHEPLALATLMSLPYAAEKDSRIKNAGLTSSIPPKERDQMVKEFWTLFEREYEGCIPPGLIFLPGAKVDLPGFGWAPRTFMEAYKLDYPDPFAKGPSSRLSPDFGLKVHYPGIILHCPPDEALRKSILATDWTLNGQEFRFPVDPYQWYAIEPADRTTATDDISAILERQTRLAIIMTRPNPREQPSEIALLVEIYQELGEGAQSMTYCCQTIRRMKIKLHVTPPEITNACDNARSLPLYGQGTTPRGDEEGPGSSCIGEALDATQAWYVDGVVDERASGLPEFRKRRSTQVPTKENVFSLTRFFEPPPAQQRSLTLPQASQLQQQQPPPPQEPEAPTPGISRRSTIADTIKRKFQRRRDRN